MKLKRASTHFGLQSASFKKRGVFDPLIGIDARFFVDPLLLKSTTTPEFINSLDFTRTYFKGVVNLLKVGSSNIAYNKALKKLKLKEVRGTGIGYGKKSDDGSAIGPQLAKQLSNTAVSLIEAGIENPEIFEVMGLFEENFGPDRLSDAVIKINEEAFYSYSERMADELGIKDRYKITCYPQSYNLPKHPLGDKPLVLLPKELLSPIPVATCYEDIQDAAAFNERLRDIFNRLISPFFSGSGKPTKSEIKSFLLADKERVSTLIKAYAQAKPEKYDFESDYSGLDKWFEEGINIAEQLPISIPKNVRNFEELDKVVQEILISLKRFIETKRGWGNLYDNKNKPLKEKYACLLFYAIALKYCDDSDIDISPQSDAGSGPVDFKLSRGGKKIIVEVKLTSGNVRQGYHTQIRKYAKSEEVTKSYYLVIQNKQSSKVLDEIIELEKSEKKAGKNPPSLFIIDGRIQESASKAKTI